AGDMASSNDTTHAETAVAMRTVVIPPSHVECFTAGTAHPSLRWRHGPILARAPPPCGRERGVKARRCGIRHNGWMPASLRKRARPPSPANDWALFLDVDGCLVDL